MKVSTLQDIRATGLFFISLNSGYKTKRVGHGAYFILFTAVAPTNGGLTNEMFH
jgi:hypothetical protein